MEEKRLLDLGRGRECPQWTINLKFCERIDLQFVHATLDPNQITNTKQQQ